MELRVLLHFRLQEDRALVGIESGREPVGDRFERGLADLRRIGVVARQRVPVGDEIVRVVFVLQLDPVLDRAEVIAEMNAAGWAEAAEDGLGLAQSKLTRPLSRKDGAV